jgi:hypothetical protein
MKFGSLKFMWIKREEDRSSEQVVMLRLLNRVSCYIPIPGIFLILNFELNSLMDWEWLDR